MPLYPALRRLLFRLDPEASHGLGIAALRAAGALPGAVGLLARRHLVAAAPCGRPCSAARSSIPWGSPPASTRMPSPSAAGPRSASASPRWGRSPRCRRRGTPGRASSATGKRAACRTPWGSTTAGWPRCSAPPRAALPGRSRLPLGVNVGKNKATPADRALTDYEILIRGLHEVCDYLVINLSSPNTPGLRDLQNEPFLRALFALAQGITAKPILVKIAPDLEAAEAVALCRAAVEAGAAGVIATNTTTDYALLPGARETGGLSGAVLREKSFRIFDAVAAALFGKALLISVGGIDSGAEAYRRLKAGASLVQVYTGLVYEGPGLPRRINQELLALMARDGVKGIAEVIGADRR